MKSTTRTITHNFTFAGTVDELLEVVGTWRALLRGEIVTASAGLSSSYVTHEPGWKMSKATNPDTFTTIHLGEHKRISLGAVKPDKEGSAARRVTVSISLLMFDLSIENPLHVMFGGTPNLEQRWFYHLGYYGNVTVYFRPQANQIAGRLEFPDVVQAECEELLNDITMWAPVQTGAAGDDYVTETEPAGQLTEEERKWYQTLLTCKQAYGNKEMTWQKIADRHGVTLKTAKRWLQKLQARRLPGLDDWPDRKN